MASKHKPWFRQVRGSYIGNSWQGALCYIPYLVVLVSSFSYGVNSSSSIAEALFKIFPVWVSATVVMQWFASNNT
jgi:hypothetical protein